MSEGHPVDDDLQRSYEQLHILNRVSVELSRKLDLNYVLQLALDSAIRLSLASDGFIGLMVDGMLHPAHVIGRFPLDKPEVYLIKQKGIAGRVLQTGHAELVLDVHNDPDYKAVISNTCAQMTFPLLTNRRIIGLLNLETSQAEHFDYASFEFINLLATHISLAIDNARMFEESERLVQELDAFSHTVAHDLKTPLNTMMGYASMLAEDYEVLSIDERTEFAERIVVASEQMTGIIDALLLLANVRMKTEVPLTPVYMKESIAAVLDRMARLVYDMQAVIVLPETWHEAVGYAPWVEEVWTNYISNAIKYGGRPPRVELGSEVIGKNRIRFWIRDNGQGLSPEEQARLFSPFTRLSQAQVKGHGLGLSIVRRIVERMGGEVGIESVVNEGSIFSFTLPAFVQNEQ